jgi:hypothetical protein
MLGASVVSEDSNGRVYMTRDISAILTEHLSWMKPEWTHMVTDYLVSDNKPISRHGLFSRQEVKPYETILSERPLCNSLDTLVSSLVVEVLKHSDRETLFPMFKNTKPRTVDSDDEKLCAEIADLSTRFHVDDMCVAKTMTFAQNNAVAYMQNIPIHDNRDWFKETTTHLAIYPHLSHINHSCDPNVAFTKDNMLVSNPDLIMSIYAIKRIAIGDELCINSLNIMCHC